jgi:hypothetical protein
MEWGVVGYLITNMALDFPMSHIKKKVKHIYAVATSDP